MGSPNRQLVPPDEILSVVVEVAVIAVVVAEEGGRMGALVTVTGNGRTLNASFTCK